MMHCEVIKLQTMHGWMYEGCPKCGSKPRIQESIVMCGAARKRLNLLSQSKFVNSIVKLFGVSFAQNFIINFLLMFNRMKVHYLVGDDSGTTSVIFWDRLAMQLIGKSAREMKLKLDEVSSDNFSILTSVYGYSMVLICMV